MKRVLVCKTKECLYAMIRQLNAKFHLESILEYKKNYNFLSQCLRIAELKKYCKIYLLLRRRNRKEKTFYRI